MRKSLRELVKLADSLGWDVCTKSRAGSGHYKLICRANGRKHHFSFSGSDVRAELNLISALKRKAME